MYVGYSFFFQIQYRHIFLQQKIWPPALTNCQPNVDCLKNGTFSSSSISSNKIDFWAWFPFEFLMSHKIGQVNIGNSSIAIPNCFSFLLDIGQKTFFPFEIIMFSLYFKMSLYWWCRHFSARRHANAKQKNWLLPTTCWTLLNLDEESVAAVAGDVFEH